VNLQPRVKMVDIARQAGVSVATVSKVINDRDGVAAETAERVRQIIAEMGYEASLGARALRSRKTNVIGILVAEFEPFSTELVKGISAAVDGTGYELLAYSGGDHGKAVGWERRSLSLLSGTLIDGAIVVTPTVVRADSSVPVVAIDPHTGPSGLATVDSDNFAGAKQATDYLLALGHRRIGFLGGRSDLESARLRETGFRKACAEAGVEVDESLILVGGYRPDSTDAPAHDLLSRPDRPSAIFAANDLSAIRTMEVAQSLGLRVPDDLSVIGFDDVPEAASAHPALTTVAQPLKQMGAAALGLLIDLINGTPGETHLRLPTHLVERQSCRAIPVDAQR